MDNSIRSIPGIHHVTAIASNPQRNLDFYTGLLGLRLVKLTVNFDDPGTYHFYFADDAGRPGTVLTFFPWPNARQGQVGGGQVAVTAFSIPSRSLGYWKDRLEQHGIPTTSLPSRFGEEGLSFLDPDSLQLELIAGEGPADHPGWTEGPVEAEHALRGFHSVTLWQDQPDPTNDLLQDILGFRFLQQEGERYRFEAGGSFARWVDVVARPGIQPGKMGAGVIHHVAWRTSNDEEQLAWRQDLLDQGYEVTPVRDRQYFHSIYFHEPGGVLFEIATDPPGFTLDETTARLGSGLRLPPWLEPRRGQIEQTLPALHLPSGLAATR